MKKEKGSKIPEFASLEEERKYWEARGPLAEEHIGKIQKPKPGQKRSSFLSVRLSGEELTQLRDIAATFGWGPSTFARLAIMSEAQNMILELAKMRRGQTELASSVGLGAPSFMFPPLYESTTRKVLEKTYNEIREKAHKACDKAKEGDSVALHAILDAILELCWATLVIREREGIECEAMQRFVKTPREL